MEIKNIYKAKKENQKILDQINNKGSNTNTIIKIISIFFITLFFLFIAGFI